jgi:hypothetical protein
LWWLDPAAPEWGVSRGKVRMRGAMSLLAIRQSQRIAERVTPVRWPSRSRPTRSGESESFTVNLYRL